MSNKTERPGRVELSDLEDAIRKLIAGVHDPEVAYGPNTDAYGKCVEAMWRAGYLAFEAVAHELGVTGWQGSCAALMLLGQLNRWDGPYMVVEAEDALYPQYDRVGDVQRWLDSDEMVEWLGAEARKHLAELPDRLTAPKVVAHWRTLVANAEARIAEKADRA